MKIHQAGFVALAYLIPTAEAFETSPIISYVLEPFEKAEFLRLNGEDAVVASEDGSSMFSHDRAFGNSSLALTFAGGDGNTSSVSWTVPKSQSAYHCLGSSRLSLWYKIVLNVDSTVMGFGAAEGTSLDVTISLGDDKTDNIGDVEVSNTERFRTNPISLTLNDKWQEITVGFTENDWYRADGTSTQSFLDLNHLREWEIEVNAEITLPGDGRPVVLLDQFACLGDGRIFGNVLDTAGSFEDAVNSSAWIEPAFFESEASETNSSFLQQDGAVRFNYTVEMTEVWGGFSSFGHEAPANAYYNLSLATHLDLSYQVPVQASELNRVHLRLILRESSECAHKANCMETERYYSFLHILDDKTGEQAHVYVPLEGNDQPTSSLYRPGWSGSTGNNVYDPGYTKGYIFEININSGGAEGDFVSGVLQLDGLQVGKADPGETAVPTALMKRDDSVRFSSSAATFTIAEFRGPTCAETCATRPDCLYAVQNIEGNAEHCYMGTSMEAKDVFLVSSSRTPSASYWKDDAVARGDFCSRCLCDSSTKVVNCRGKNLTVLPSSLTPPKGEEWAPTVLDLRDNPYLVYIGEEALSLQSWTFQLEELYLPKELVYIAPGNIVDLPDLRTLEIEASAGQKNSSNFVQSSEDTFADVCCVGQETSSLGSTSFCNMSRSSVGDDTVYLPFIRYPDPSFLTELQADAEFLGEASENARKCAEACAITDGCGYFTYDSRIKEAEATCLLFRDTSQELFSCCESTDYSDENQTIPGLISGYPAKTRHQKDSARVIVHTAQARASFTSDYHVQYQVSLGSMPLRGAVWIEPHLLSEPGSRVTFVPVRTALYDNKTVANISIYVSDPVQESVSIDNNIISCDTAFTSFVVWEESDRNVLLVIDVPENGLSVWVIVGAILAGLALILIVGAFTFVELKKRDNDNIWQVDPKELKFDSPPCAVGRGTFGLVLLANYRGTKVAVKRVIPAKKMGDPDAHDTSNGADLTSGGSISQFFDSSILLVNKKDGSASVFKSLRRHRRSTGQARSHLQASFVSEMRLLAKLRHPSITTVMGAVIQPGQDPMMVLEYMEYGSLYDILHNDTIAIEGEHVLPILQDVAQGMRFLHAADPQIIHSDLKAQNILIDRRFRAKVTDFGLSQKQNLGAAGTPFWMAPELLRGETSNNALTDVYSFGMVVYENFSRRKPYEGENAQAVIMLIADPSVNKRPPVPKNCPPAAKATMVECLSGEPELRPSFEEIDETLKTLSPSEMHPELDTAPGNLLKDLKAGSRSDAILTDFFPAKVVEALKKNRPVEPETRECATVLVADLAQSSALNKLSTAKTTDLISRLLGDLRELARRTGVFTVATNRTSFIGVTNLIADQADHASRMAVFATHAIQLARRTPLDMEDQSLGYVSIRVGFDSGPITANVVGARVPRYGLFGDTVNAAHLMEKNSYTNRILCSERSADLISEHRLPQSLVVVEPRGQVTGGINAFWVSDH